jgi:hypothetical protein
MSLSLSLLLSKQRATKSALEHRQGRFSFLVTREKTIPMSQFLSTLVDTIWLIAHRSEHNARWCDTTAKPPTLAKEPNMSEPRTVQSPLSAKFEQMMLETHPRQSLLKIGDTTAGYRDDSTYHMYLGFVLACEMVNDLLPASEPQQTKAFDKLCAEAREEHHNLDRDSFEMGCKAIINRVPSRYK